VELQRSPEGPVSSGYQVPAAQGENGQRKGQRGEIRRQLLLYKLKGTAAKGVINLKKKLCLVDGEEKFGFWGTLGKERVKRGSG